MPQERATDRAAPRPRTLAVDIGGSGIKAMVLDADGRPLTERARVATPRPATPAAVLAAVVALAKRQGEFERVSVGFPGVVRHGITRTAPNLHPSWAGFRLAETLAKRLGKPVRAANDGDVQGYGAIEGRDVELVLTLGTGLGSALFVDGVLVPNLELAHHPFEDGKTYEQRLGNRALKRAGVKKWNKRLRRAIAQLEQVFNYDRLFIGGGNAEKITGALPPNAKLVSNRAGLLGGIALWREDAKTAGPR
ncbi:ROK family protein [Nitrospira sp. Kam-Ns4a]